MTDLLTALRDFNKDRKFNRKGPLCVALVVTQHARKMGLPDTYALPKNYNDAYHLAGDGVAVPVVRFLAEHILEPLLAAALAVENKAA